jgi:hypothetical protein
MGEGHNVLYKGHNVPIALSSRPTGAAPDENQTQRSDDSALDKAGPPAILRRLGCADHHEPRRVGANPALEGKARRGRTRGSEGQPYRPTGRRHRASEPDLVRAQHRPPNCRRPAPPINRWMAATLDGMVEDLDAVFEAKFMLPWSFSEEAAAEKHMAQLQHNMWVTNARSAALSIITGGGKWIEMTIPADALYQHFLVTAERRFWRCVQTGETPRHMGSTRRGRGSKQSA